MQLGVIPFTNCVYGLRLRTAFTDCVYLVVKTQPESEDADADVEGLVKDAEAMVDEVVEMPTASLKALSKGLMEARPAEEEEEVVTTRVEVRAVVTEEDVVEVEEVVDSTVVTESRVGCGGD